ncbi:hypothetical protein [Azospirillum doebereinerae]|uniref:Uncharacterized protein n=1 Tax=Azospirillum doebereinerae TaxID=92933 RepID=A0A433JDD5_9PROT|nr:hypothetical protein [Azospirillum doebereinerae]MCG5240430.1 hypothetical protein [Azospirillum doebereinerae]RUQ74920.1 hypothetical protein EJ913_03350 [Azospirillum doebereinerae]
MDNRSAFLELAVNGAVASFGAMANYLYAHIAKNVPLNWLRFLSTIGLGFFIGQVVGDFLPTDFAYRDGTLLIAGFSVYPLLQILEIKGVEFVGRHLGVGPLTAPSARKRKDGSNA